MNVQTMRGISAKLSETSQAHHSRYAQAASPCQCDWRRAKSLLRLRRPKYEQVLRELGVRPLKVQASRGVIVKLTEGSEVEVMGAEEQEAATL